MREQLNLRNDDIQRGIAAERAKRIAHERAVAKRMVEQGKLTREQMEEFLREMENYKNDSE
jgi:polyhydroxyalkanoate synthesis regulator phasin